ncbi:MAG: ATP-binding protein [Candidatus Berkiella sp.]
MRPLHPLLTRQLKRAGIDLSQRDDPALLKLLEFVSNGYQEADEGRYIVERSLEISSQEMNELRSNLQKEREIMQSVMSEGVCVLDPYLNIKEVNITASLMLYCSSSITKGKYFPDIFKLYTYEKNVKEEVTIAMLMDTFAKNEILHCERGLLKSSQGIETTISFSLNPLPYTKEGKFNGCVLVFRDISESIKYEQAMRNALVTAEQSNIAKTNFLANMSHEIRTPMNGILGMLQLLMHTTLNDQQQHYLEKSYECASYLLKLLGDILDLTKIESGNMELEKLEFNLKSELESFIVLYALQCKQKKIDFTITFDDNIPNKLIGDPSKLKQILNNIANNALKFTSSGGDISIHFYILENSDDDYYLTANIKDSGIGIPENVIPKIFSIFSQADESTTRKFGGTGLGLAITKQLVEQMGGEIHVDSVVGEGSTFSFKIKMQKPDASVIQNTKSEVKVAAGLPPQYGSQVLVVDDEPTNQEISRDILHLFGCQVKTAQSGKIALQALQENNYDLILMDCQMPEMDGFETTEAIRRLETLHDNNKNNIIIALTANAQKGIKDRCLASGMNDCLVKPLKINDLANMLQKYLPAPT